MPMDLTMMRPTHRHGKLIADLAPERADLRKAQVMRIGRCAAAHQARLAGYELAMILVAQPDGLGRNAATAGASLRAASR